MFVLSAGMPKSGSTLFSHYQRDVIHHAVRGNGQELLEQRILDGTIPGIGHFVYGTDTAEVLHALLKLSNDSGPFLVKSHISVNSVVTEMALKGEVLITYIHRDPRDVILSAIDHGRRPVKNVAANSYFRQFDCIDHALPLVREFCKTGIEWISSGICEVFTYYDLLSNPEGVIDRFCTMLGATVDKPFVDEMIMKYTVLQVQGRRQFNTGKLNRFTDEMAPEDIIRCTRELEEEIRLFGYR